MSDVTGKIDEVCETAGEYECSVCGKYLGINAGDKFPECEVCMDPDLTWQLDPDLTWQLR